MKLLAVDTSGPVCGVAVLEEGKILYEGAAVNRLTHSVSLMPMVEEALNKCSTDISEIDLYAAVVGPGSFTGVRIGVSAVKGMAHGAGKPCVAVDALEALAWGVSLTPDLICPIQDARAGQVYGAAFQPGQIPRRVMEDTAAKLDEFACSDELEKVSGLPMPRTLRELPTKQKRHNDVVEPASMPDEVRLWAK